jgi:YegS C-terminal NAD kinase beta sandwich-like domain
VTRPFRRGEPWGQAASGPPDVEVAGDDTDLAAIATRRPGALVRFRPSPRSDLGRGLGLPSAGAGATEVAVDALAVESNAGVGDAAGVSAAGVNAVNAVVLGPAPDRLRWGARAAAMSVTVDGRRWFGGRATTVVVANGQFLRGADVVPRGHPGDGWAEVQVYALTRWERRPMRRRLATGTHVPHPRVHGGRARRVEVEVAGRGLPLEVDGRPEGRTDRLVATLVPAAIRLLV